MGKSSQRVLVKVNGQEYLVEVGDLSASPVIVVVDGHTYEVVVEDHAADVAVRPVETSQKEISKEQNTITKAREAYVLAPLPGDIVDIKVQPGQQVSVGDCICVIDAMKMRNEIRSPRDGSIASVEVSMGQSVDYGDVLITFE